MPEDYVGAAAATLNQTVGPDYTGDLIRGGARHLEATFPTGIPLDTTADVIAATVLAGAMAELTRGEIEHGLLAGAKEAVRDAELGALADTLRAAYRAAKSTPDNPIQGLIDFADAAGVDLSGTDPALEPAEPSGGALEQLAVVIAEARLNGVRAGGYTLARMILQAGYTRGSIAEQAVIAHDTDGSTAYRFAAPGVLLTGQPRVTLSGDQWCLEQEVDGVTVRAVAEDEVGAILALVAQLLAPIGPEVPGDNS